MPEIDPELLAQERVRRLQEAKAVADIEVPNRPKWCDLVVARRERDPNNRLAEWTMIELVLGRRIT